MEKAQRNLAMRRRSVPIPTSRAYCTQELYRAGRSCTARAPSPSFLVQGGGVQSHNQAAMAGWPQRSPVDTPYSSTCIPRSRRRSLAMTGISVRGGDPLPGAGTVAGRGSIEGMRRVVQGGLTCSKPQDRGRPEPFHVSGLQENEERGQRKGKREKGPRATGWAGREGWKPCPQRARVWS